MSEDQRDAIIGRTVREHSEASKELATLYAEAEYLGNYLTALGHALRANHSLYAGPFGTFTGHADLRKWPSRESLEKLAQDIQEAQENKKRLSDILAEAGFKPAS